MMTPSVLSLLLLLPSVFPSTAPQDRPKPDRAQAERAPSDRAAMAKAKHELSLSLPVAGLTEQDSTQARNELAAIVLPGFQCPKCQAFDGRKGRCPKCKVELAAGSFPVLDRIEPDVARSKIDMHLVGNGPVRLSQVTDALSRAHVTVDVEAVLLPAPVTLVLQGGAGEKVEETLQRRLTDAGLYGAVKAVHEAKSGLYLVSARPGEHAAPSRQAVMAALAADPDLPQLYDVVWDFGSGHRADKAGKKAAPGGGKPRPGKGGKGHDGGKGKKKGDRGKQGGDRG